MATITNITVKKADNTTDVVYTGLQGSAGDKLPAVWRCETAAAIRAYRPVLKVQTQFNGPRTARKSYVSYDYPVVRNVGGVDTVVHTVPMSLNVLIPEGLTDAEVSEAVAQGFNLFQHVTIRNQVKIGYADN